MEETPIVQSEAKPELAAGRSYRRRGPSAGAVLTFVVGLVGVAALGATAWVYAETQRDIARVSTDIAQIKLSLELFGRQQPVAATSDDADAASLLDLSNRLAILESNWRGGAAAPAVVPSTQPALPQVEGAVANGGDCLPTATRFMVSAGDTYPVCGTTGSVSIAGVDNGFLTLGDGTVIAQGATVGLPGTQCMIGMLPSDGGSISGFAEIRVVC